MIYRGAHDRQAEADVHAHIKPDHLDRDVGLIVIHGDYGVELAAVGTSEDGIGRPGAGEIEAAGSGCFDGWGEDRGLLSAEQAVLAS